MNLLDLMDGRKAAAGFRIEGLSAIRRVHPTGVVIKARALEEVNCQEAVAGMNRKPGNAETGSVLHR